MVEIIPKKPIKKIFPWQEILFYISLVLLMGVVLGYSILIYLESKARLTLEGVKGKITTVGTIEDRILETEVLAHKERIEDFSILIKEYHKSSNFFDFLEKITHPQIWFTSLKLETRALQVTLFGRAPNFQVLGQQLEIFQKQDLIEEVKLSDMLLGEGGEVEFSISLSLASQIFK